MTPAPRWAAAPSVGVDEGTLSMVVAGGWVVVRMAEVEVGLRIEVVELCAMVVEVVVLSMLDEEVVVGVEEESLMVLTPWDMVMVTVESPLPSAALMLKGKEYWKTSGLAELEMERPYLASLPSLESTSHEYLPAALSMPAT